MKRRDIRYFCICFLVILISASCPQMIAANQPNVILIICDDLNDDVDGFGGHPQSKTPNMARPADSGVSFTPMNTL